MTEVAGRWANRWPVTEIVVAAVHQYHPGVAVHGARYAVAPTAVSR